MDMQEPNERADVGRYRLKKAVVFSVGMCLLAVAAAVAYGLCTLQLKNVTQSIENSQRELQQSWVDKTLEAAHAWNATLLDQVRLVSGAEVFRLYAMDVSALGPEGLQRLTSPNASESDDETVASLAEQMKYMQDLLQDFIRSKGWISARIVTQDGLPLLMRHGDTSLDENDIALVRKAMRSSAIAYGSVRMHHGVPVISLADPMFEVLGRGGDAPVAALFATIPLENVLKDLLSLRKEHIGLLPSIVQHVGHGAEAIVLRNGVPSVEPVSLIIPEGSLPFKRRSALVGEDDTYSLGNRLSGLGWLVVTEAPASMVDKRVQNQARQIYGLGILGSLGAALLLAFIWASLVSRSHRATALRFQSLYKLIRRQKMLLDSVNASLQAGLMLMDGKGQVQLCNPAFAQMAERDEESLHGEAIASLLPAEAAENLFKGMEQVSSSGSEGSLEISVPRLGDMHLYRVTLFPFEERQNEQGNIVVHGGCVGIFQDITEFRRRAEVARRQKALLDSVNASLQAGLMLMDGEGLVQMCNPAFEQMVDKEEGSVVGSSIGVVLPVDASDKLFAGMERVCSDGHEASLEIAVLRKEERRLYRVTLFPFEEKKEGQTGTSVHGGCVGIFQDITEFRRRAEVARRQKALLDSVNASLQAGLMLMDGNGYVQMCNPAFGQMVNMEEHAVVGMGIASVLPMEAADKLVSGMELVCSGGRESSLEISVPGEDATRLFRVTLFPFEEKKEGQTEASVHGGCVGIFQDITEFRRRAEVARRQKALLDSVNASLQAGLMLMDEDGYVQMCNPAFSQLTGKPEQAIVGITIDDVLSSEAAAKLYVAMEQVRLNGSEYSLEISLQRDNETRLYRVTLFPFEEKQGETTAGKGGCVGIFQDITEFRRRAEAARKRQANSVAALVHAIESVDANLVGHSLKMENVAKLLSSAMKLSDTDRETLRFAARLSQVGKIFVPRDLLAKKGKLSPQEQAEVNRAPEYAYNILRDMQFSLPVPEAVYQMGERMDGSGQPRHLKGDEIALNARVLAIVNAFCAMVSTRSYRAGMPPEKAIDLLSQDARFDQQVVAVLAKIDPKELLNAVTEATNEEL